MLLRSMMPFGTKLRRVVILLFVYKKQKCNTLICPLLKNLHLGVLINLISSLLIKLQEEFLCFGIALFSRVILLISSRLA